MRRRRGLGSGISGGRVAARVAPGQEAAQAPDALVRRALLVASLLEAPTVAVDLTDRAARLAHVPYLRADVGAHRAAALLRGGFLDAAARAIEDAWSDLRAVADPLGDPGMQAWLHALALHARVAADEPAAAGEALRSLLDDTLPDPMRSGALRAFGEALEAHDRVDWLSCASLPEPLRGAPSRELLRPGDLLVGRWRDRTDGDAVPAEPLA